MPELIPAAPGSPGTYLATFDRISRNHDVPPLAVHGDADAIAEQVYRYAKPKCASRGIEVVIDLEDRKGTIFAGFQVAGHVTLEPTDA